MSDSTKTYAAQRYDIIEEWANGYYGVTASRDQVLWLMGMLSNINYAESVERGELLAQRIADGKCAVLGETCLTHHVPNDVYHTVFHGGTND